MNTVYLAGTAVADQNYPAEVSEEIASLALKEGTFNLYGVDDVLAIERQIRSPATWIIFPATPYSHLCLKLWSSCDDGLYFTRETSVCTNYLLEGLAFNRQFAPQVYLGIAPVQLLAERKLYCGKIIPFPEKEKLEKDRPYALVMRRLPDSWRLDHYLYDGKQLYNGTLATYQGMDFLARSIAEIHGQLKSATTALDTLRYTEEKLSLNRELFKKALYMLKADMETCKYINSLMERAYRQLTKLFEERIRQKHIKRCHGDLKTANLWVQPENTGDNGFEKRERQLLLLDCVDFDARFCNIDTLSDVAMLAVDLEMRIDRASLRNVTSHRGKTQALSFLRNYLYYASEQDKEETWRLLEYYMTEKAMICAYMSVLYDRLFTYGRRYVEVALSHANSLEKHLENGLSAVPKRKTGPLPAHSR
jgi:aminoglycoside phosphotransferase family enzyme